MSVLEDPRCERPQPKPETKEKGMTVSIILSDLVMKQCRHVLRHAAAADKDGVFCNLLGRTLLNLNDNDDEGLLGYPAMVSRPLDFRTVDLRLAAGAYGGSHEAFFEDVQEVYVFHCFVKLQKLDFMKDLLSQIIIFPISKIINCTCRSRYVKVCPFRLLSNSLQHTNGILFFMLIL